MTVTINMNRLDYDRRSNKTIVYVEDTKLHKIADAWFTKNNLYSLRVRSKAWKMICRYISSKCGFHLASHFKLEQSRVKFNHKAGCSCGCSPGFVIKPAPEGLSSHNVWADIKVTESDVQGLECLISSMKFIKASQADKIAHEQVCKQVPAGGS